MNFDFITLGWFSLLSPTGWAVLAGLALVAVVLISKRVAEERPYGRPRTAQKQVATIEVAENSVPREILVTEITEERFIEVPLEEEKPKSGGHKRKKQA